MHSYTLRYIYLGGNKISLIVMNKLRQTLLILMYLLPAIGLSPGGRSTVHIYAQTVHRTTRNKLYIEQQNNKNNTTTGECGPCPVLARYTLEFALHLRKKHGKTSVRVAASIY